MTLRSIELWMATKPKHSGNTKTAGLLLPSGKAERTQTYSITMEKFKYVTERELNCSLQQLYPYFSTAIGLAQWFAEDVKAEDKKNFIIYWNNTEQRVKIVAHRANHLVRFQFESEEINEEPPSYLEFRLSYNEFTESTFVTITDYSEMTDSEELDVLWKSLMDKLREVLGDTQTSM